MRDDLEVRLREEAASFATAISPRPAEAIRARGDRRRRRAAAMSAALALAVLTLGAGGAYAAITRPAHAPAPMTSHSARPHPTGSPQPAPGGHFRAWVGTTSIYGIACAGDTECLAVGSGYRHEAGPGVSLSERWNGSNWADVAAPDPAGGNGGELVGVSCPRADVCLAVGRVLFGKPYAERWDGARWSLTRLPLPAGSSDDRLGSIACPGPADCWSVGSAGYNVGQPGQRYAPLIEHWNGVAWSPVPSPSAGVQSALVSVSCPDSGTCWAVGNWVAGHGRRGGTLTEHWNGAAWTITATPTDHSGVSGDVPGPTVGVGNQHGVTVMAVSCATTAACLAVGTDGKGQAYSQRWNGSAWAVAAVPAPARSSGSILSSVTCLSPRWCMAGGAFSAPAGTASTLAEVWDGSSWRIVPSENPAGAGGKQLGQVACADTSHCWAAGSIGIQSFLTRWNGAGWYLYPWAGK